MIMNLGAMLLAFAAATAITLWLRREATRLRLLDIPNDRSSHAVPTPRGGGLAIVVVVLVALPVIAWFSGNVQWNALIVYSLISALIAGLGWLDDRQSLSARGRLMVQIGVAGLAIIGFGYFESITLPLIGVLPLGWLGLPLTLVWIVGLTNAYNFMDGVDGLAAGQAIIAGLVWSLVGWEKTPLVSSLGMLIAVSSFGFLLHNWSPARIFMGDVGSGFLGFSFAILPLLAAYEPPSSEQGYWIAGVLFMGIFIFDAGLTFLRRLIHKENILEAHRSHLYQRLLKRGYSHHAVTIFYLTLTLLLCGCGLLYLQAGAHGLAIGLSGVIVLALFLAVTIAERRPIA